MKKVRIIARLDIKGPNVIKGIQFECLRVLGKPDEMAENYYLQGVDELIYLDTVANLYQRQKLINIVKRASESVYVPITIGGGIRTLDDIRELLKAGADKVAINTEATKNPELIRNAANMFGSQCVVVSVEAKRVGKSKWEAYADHGREPTRLDVVEWVKRAQELGAGEILLTSVDADGTEAGFDMELIKSVSEVVSASLVVSGGAGSIVDFVQCVNECNVDGVAAGSIFHYKRHSIREIKEELYNKGFPVRRSLSVVATDKEPQLEYDIANYNKFTLNQLSDETLNTHNISKDYEQDDLSHIRAYDVGVVNCGINNLRSVINAFKRIGKIAKLINTPEEVLSSKCLVIPGVGTFEHGMNALTDKGLIDPIREKVKEGIPLLGICLGMQFLFSESNEFGLHKGLDLIPGRVVPLKQPSKVVERGYKVPHIGWSELQKPSYGKDITWKDTILEDTEPGSDVFFAHSFYAIPDDQRNCVATVEYGGQEFCVVAVKDNIVAIQFHPEKSGSVGLNILKFLCKQNNKYRKGKELWI
jgi:imidazole glycerol phosphate synthase glutamine amidotransferase subunit